MRCGPKKGSLLDLTDTRKVGNQRPGEKSTILPGWGERSMWLGTDGKQAPRQALPRIGWTSPRYSFYYNAVLRLDMLTLINAYLIVGTA